MIIYQKTIFYILLSAFCFLFPGHILAAEIFINPENQNINVGEQFQVDLLLDTEDEYINAIEGKIAFPAEILELKEIRDGNSIINFWIERPNKQQGEIIFSGIVPGGYIGENGLIFSAIFFSKNEGEGAIEIREVKTLLNDGKGTEAKLKISNLTLFISQQTAGSDSQILDIEDIVPPEPFEPMIAQDPNLFDNQYFLVFATQDKGSGIDYYEIQEGNRQFVIAKSPYALQNQNLDEEIIVKAIDKNNNERVAIVPAENPKPWYKNYYIFVILIIGITFACFIWKILWKKRKQI